MQFTKRVHAHTAKVFLITCLLLAALTACSKTSEQMPDDGEMNGTTYTNHYFNFTMAVPDGWYPIDQKTIDALNEQGRKMLAGDDKNMDANLKAAQQNTFTLFTTFQKPPGTPGTFNPAVSCLAEKVGHLPGIGSGHDYLLLIKNTLKMGQMKVNIADTITPVNFSGKEFHVLNIELPMGNLTIKQSFYATIQNDYALAFVTTYQDDSQNSVIQKSLQSMRFQ